MLLDGLQLVRLGGSLFEGVVLSSRGISGEEAGQVGAWRGFVRVSCAGRGPRLAGALSARGVSHRRHLRDAAIVRACVCLSQACAETTRVTTHTPAAQWAPLSRAHPLLPRRRPGDKIGLLRWNQPHRDSMIHLMAKENSGIKILYLVSTKLR